MKKLIHFVVLTIGLFIIIDSCSKSELDTASEIPSSEEKVVPDADKIAITVSIPEEGLTKVALTPGVNGSNDPILKLTWEVEDIVTINGKGFMITDEKYITNDGKSATFIGPNEPGNGPYTIVYSNLENVNQQIQASDNNTDLLGYTATLTDVNAYKDVQFSSDWATEHGGTFSQSGVLHVQAKLPSAEIADAVQKVIIRTPGNNLLNGSDALEVTINTPGVEGESQVVNVYAVLSEATTLTADTELLFNFQVGEKAYQKYTAYRKITSNTNLVLGQVNKLKINCSKIDSSAGTSDAGTEDNPYLIGDQNQMDAVHDLLKAGETKYFKLIDDIDMTGISWARLNQDPFTKAVNLNGNNKTISNLNNALFQDFNGEANNLTIDNSTVTSSAELLGIFACSVKTAASVVNNVDITNSSLNATSSYCGGLIGQADVNVQISGININNTNITGGLAGGVIGYPTSTATIDDCHYEGGTITSNAQYTGGIVAATANNKTTSISDCTVKNATLTSAYHRLGSIIGAMRNGTTVERCSAGDENNPIIITMTGAAACYTGGFIGLMEGGEVKDNCTAYVNLTGVKTSIGGFIGRMTAGKISGCKSYGSVSGTGTIGGFFGDVTGATEIKNNESHCSVTATSTYVGGFVGYLKGSISCSNCWHYNSTVASSLGGQKECYIGGFAGYIGTKSEAFTGTISNCFVYKAKVDAVKYKSDNTADSSGSWVGGFAGGIGSSTYGNNSGKVEKCGVHNTAIFGSTYTGGFAGVSYSKIEKCRVNGTPTIQCYNNSIGGFIGYQQGNSVTYCYSNATVRHANKSNVGGLIGNAKNTTIEECYSAGNLTNSDKNNDDHKTTWGGMIGVQVSVTTLRLIRWNNSNSTNIVGNESSVPTGCYVRGANETDFTTKATDLGWSIDGTIWVYKQDDIPTLKDV